LTGSGRLVSVGRVGKSHGRDGSFYVDSASHPLPEGLSVTIAGRQVTVERRAGTQERPLLRLSGVSDREHAAELWGEALLVDLEDAPLASDEWLAEDLVGCEVVGIGTVERVVQAPSCDLLEVGSDGVLIPFISDAIKLIDVEARRIHVDREFLALHAPSEDRRE
jgi:16S rRNA processing protein RimM